MEADVYEAFSANMEKMALDEARMDAFVDELEAIEKQAILGALGGIGGALRGGAAALKGGAKMLSKGRGVGGVGGALGRVGSGLKGGFAHGSKLTGRHAVRNVAIGAGAAGLGVGALGGAALSGRGDQRR